MKRLLAVCLLMSIAGFVQAQTFAGHVMIGGGIGYTKTEYEKISYSPQDIRALTVNPQVGFFVTNNLAVGLQVSYVRTNYSDIDPFLVETESTYTSATLSPFARYYIFTSNEKFAFYAQAMAGLGFSKSESDSSPGARKGNSISAQLSPGFAYFLSEKWALDLQLNGISYASYESDTWDGYDYKYSIFTFGVSSLNPILGFRYFIGK